MNDRELSSHFEQWHSETRQAKQHRMRYGKDVSWVGIPNYYDKRVHWAWLAFKGGYEYFLGKHKWSMYPATRPDDLDCAYIVIDKDGNEHRTHVDLVDNDTVTGSIAAFVAVPNVIMFRKV